MQATKAVQFHHNNNNDLLPLLETFRRMVNEAMRIGKEHNIRSRNKLITTRYEDFKKYAEGHTLHIAGHSNYRMDCSNHYWSCIGTQIKFLCINTPLKWLDKFKKASQTENESND